MVIAHMAMVDVVMAYMAMVDKVMVHTVMVHHIVMAHKVTLYIGMVCTVMAHIVMVVYSYGPHSDGTLRARIAAAARFHRSHSSHTVRKPAPNKTHTVPLR